MLVKDIFGQSELSLIVLNYFKISFITKPSFKKGLKSQNCLSDILPSCLDKHFETELIVHCLGHALRVCI